MIWTIIFSICVGALISGVILTIVLSVMAASSMSSGHMDGADHDFGHLDGVDHDLGYLDGVDHDLGHLDGADHDFGHLDGVDHDFGHLDGVDHDLGHLDGADHDLGHLDGVDHATEVLNKDFINIEDSTPLSLIFSLYLLWFGAIGTFTYDFFALNLKWVWLILILLFPIALVKLISKLWRKFSKNTMYRVRTGKNLLGREAVVKIPVSADGGIVSVKNPDSVQQIGVKSLFPLSWFYSGDIVYICDYQNGIYLVDDNPSNVRLNINQDTKELLHAQENI